MPPYKEKDLKEILLKTQLGNVDLSGKVMKRLYAEQQKKERFYMKYKIGILVTMGMLLTATSGFAAVHYQSLSNKDGEVVYQVKPANEYPALQEEDAQRQKISPVTYTELTALQAELSNQPVTIADHLPGGYSFYDASVYYEPVNPVNPQAPEEASVTADKLLNLTVAYRKGNQEVTVSILKSDGPSTGYVDDKVDFTAEKLMAEGVEMIYTQYKGGNNLTWSAEIPGRQEILRYQIDEMSGQYFSKEEMVRMAEPFLK